MTTPEEFERERPYLTRLAYRMLGSVSDAEDMVQETFLRWKQAHEPRLETPRAWFTRTCTRLCLDRLKSAQRERERYPGEWLPEPVVEDPPGSSNELDETLSMALLHTIERLRPAERAAFLLHDVFDYGFDEVAEILGLRSAHCRKLATRAREHLAGPPARGADTTTVRRLSEAFFRAVRGGDTQGLRAVLAEDVVLRADGGGKALAVHYPLHGAERVAHFFERIHAAAPQDFRPRERWFNGAPGAVVFVAGQPVSAFQFHVESDRIAAIFVLRNPDKLSAFAERT